MTKFDLYIQKLKVNFRNSGIISPLTASYEITALCNLSCEHCYNKNENKTSEISSLFKKKEIISKLKDLGVLDLSICGGELFMDKDTIPVIKHAKSVGLRVVVLTNGLLITTEIIAQLKSILDENDIIQLSIDDIVDNGESKQRHLNSEQKTATLNCLKELIKENINVVVNITPTVLNQNYIIDIVKKVDALGLKNIGVTPYVPMGGKNADIIKPDYRLLSAVHKTVFDYAKSRGMNYGGGIEGHICQSFIEHNTSNALQNGFSMRRCDASEFNIHISSNGNIYPCVFMERQDFLIANICDTIEKIKVNMKKVNDKIKVELPHKCVSCHLIYECGGGCPGLILDRYNSLDHVDPRCRW